MVRARRRFLDAGHYRPLVDAILALTGDSLDRGSRFPAGNGPLVLDVGCGEGYYGGTVAEALRAKYGACRLYGLDISRAALRLAARTYREAVFFLNDVGSRICLADGAADVLLDIFAPRNAGEFARVLRPGGIALIVIPEEWHLHELRRALPLLSIAPGKRGRTVDQLSAHFAIQGESAVAYGVRLTLPDLRDLVRMSPSAHHLEDVRLEGLRDMDVTVAFRILRFENGS
jgi:23S rRNA (guanine745-N1)-methyltransferase